jgi:hypothetical protein
MFYRKYTIVKKEIPMDLKEVRKAIEKLRKDVSAETVVRFREATDGIGLVVVSPTGVLMPEVMVGDRRSMYDYIALKGWSIRLQQRFQVGKRFGKGGIIQKVEFLLQAEDVAPKNLWTGQEDVLAGDWEFLQDEKPDHYLFAAVLIAREMLDRNMVAEGELLDAFENDPLPRLRINRSGMTLRQAWENFQAYMDDAEDERILAARLYIRQKPVEDDRSPISGVAQQVPSHIDLSAVIAEKVGHQRWNPEQRGIPSRWNRWMEEWLVNIGVCDSDATISAVFSSESLSPWRWRVPSSRSPAGRAAQVKNYLASKFDSSGQNALILFFEEIIVRYPGRDAEMMRLALLEWVEGYSESIVLQENTAFRQDGQQVGVQINIQGGQVGHVGHNANIGRMDFSRRK